MSLHRPIGFVLLGCALTYGCGGASPPSELREARAAYKEASTGPASELAPADLHEAETALKEAEDKFDNDGNSARTRDLAYVAHRKAQLAASRARTMQAEREAERAALARREAQRSRMNRAESALAESRDELDTERQRREEAERRAQEAMEKLRASAEVKEEPRGTVITLSGSVLYQTGKATLLPSAQRRLDEVAEALRQYPDRTFVVEGHTDTTGSAEMNMALSRARADAVVDYLVDRGVPREQLRSEGLGESRPAVEETTAEGRAINRRVEIIVAPGDRNRPPSDTGREDAPPARSIE